MKIDSPNGVIKMKLSSLVRSTFLAALSSVSLLSAGIALAEETPSTVKGVEIIDSAKAKSLMDSGVKMYDVRVANEYAESHIKGTVSIPYKNNSTNTPDFDGSMDVWDVSKLPADKAQPLIIQGNSPIGWRHYKASVLAVKAGHKKVYWLRNGIAEWKAKGFPME
jgi:rhodanese-related sulfurtransferase